MNYDCILVIKYPDKGHISDRNMLLQNGNVQLNMFINGLSCKYKASRRILTQFGYTGAATDPTTCDT